MTPRYLLFYAGLNTPGGIEQIGLAVSDDLARWQSAFPAPIIPLRSSGAADETQTSNPCVLREGGVFRMWYQGRAADGRISVCYAESSDGFTWRADPRPVLAPSSEERGKYRAGFHHPHVLFDRERKLYCMWFARQSGARSTIGYAESSDGRVWGIIDDAVVCPEFPWEGAFLYYPFVEKRADTYELWYTGRSPGRTWRIGRAKSQDGISWRKDFDNPHIPPTMMPRRARLFADVALRLMRRKVAQALNGAASPYVHSENGVPALLVHEVGIQGRLSIGRYKQSSSGVWRVEQRDILAPCAGAWDAYFQADPFLFEKI